MQKAVVVGGLRTPFVKAGGQFSDLTSLDLGITLLEALFNRYKIEVDEVVLSTVLHDPRIANLAREVILRSNVNNNISAHTVSNNCISTIVAIANVVDGIKSGRIGSGVAGGIESMSTTALTFNHNAERYFRSLNKAKSINDKISALLKYRPNFAIPTLPSPKEPSTGLTMGQHCELMVKEWGIKRIEQDQLAFASHKRACNAWEKGIFANEVISINGVDKDDIIRSNTTIEKLSTLRPVFDKSTNGTITAGNSSALTDGASAVIIMSEELALNRKYIPLLMVKDIQFSAVNPEDGLLMAPALALPRLLKRANLTLDDIDIFEIHEAFAGQVLCNRLAWQKGWQKYQDATAIGTIPEDKYNKHGGSLAIGHPFAATGTRLLMSIAKILQETQGRYGVISVCAAGGMGATVLVERFGN
jgi:acetyl-CoA acetyltransferase family protein